MRRGSQTVRQRSAKSRKSVRLRSTPPFFCPNPGKKNEYRQGFASYRVSGASYFAVSRKMLHTPSGVLHKNKSRSVLLIPPLYPGISLQEVISLFADFVRLLFYLGKFFPKCQITSVSLFFTPYNITRQVCHCIFRLGHINIHYQLEIVVFPGISAI